MQRARTHILVVDDEAGIRDLFKRILERRGYVCHTAHSGDAALEVLTTQAADLVLVDIMMPGMSGLVLFQHIKERYPGLPVILVTAVDDLNIAVGQLKHGVYDYISKPVSREHLQRAVEEALGRRQAVVEEDRRLSLLEEQVSRHVQELEAKAQEIHGLNSIIQAELSGDFTAGDGISADLLSLQRGDISRASHQPFSSVEVIPEEQRKSMAAELHDDTMAELSSLGIELAFIKRQVSSVSPELELSLDEIRNRLNATQQRLREIVQGIYPPALAMLGLRSALLSLLTNHSSRTIESPHPLEIELRTTGFHGDDRLPNEVELGIYRFIQQGMTNVIQHARARKLNIVLAWSDSGLDLSLIDDGIGFDADNVRKSPPDGHFGLVNLRGRIEMLEGTFEIESQVALGTTLRASVPVPNGVRGPKKVQTSTFVLNNQGSN